MQTGDGWALRHSAMLRHWCSKVSLRLVHAVPSSNVLPQLLAAHQALCCLHAFMQAVKRLAAQLHAALKPLLTACSS